jgi:hypothetical protein
MKRNCTHLKASMMDGDWCFFSIGESVVSGCGSVGTMGEERRANNDHGRSVRDRVAADFCSDLKYERCHQRTFESKLFILGN